MLTDEQIRELEMLLKNHKQSDRSLRIAEVTNLIYPVDKKSRQHKVRLTSE
ncbi:MAG: hypothetical protein U5K84_01135 [Alkalibacterium sp.]|nr:hypothetical protein [Alkalibacterium sp.]